MRMMFPWPSYAEALASSRLAIWLKVHLIPREVAQSWIRSTTRNGFLSGQNDSRVSLYVCSSNVFSNPVQCFHYKARNKSSYCRLAVLCLPIFSKLFYLFFNMQTTTTRVKERNQMPIRHGGYSVGVSKRVSSLLFFFFI